ncbi:hypothetical protein MKW92_040969 [Papaver armeniacum]|nr:hypothetical protein MKW92_040969 [Papaver armeniacum]
MAKSILWSKWGRKEWIISAIGFTVLSSAIIMTLDSSLLSSSSSSVSDRVPNQIQRTPLVDLILLQNAQQKGAGNQKFLSLIRILLKILKLMYFGCWEIVCLDGSSPGYHFSKGFDSVESCTLRKGTALGSSKLMFRRVPFTGIFSSNEPQNPDFFNWNKVKIRYCDGASFAGNQNEPESGSGLFFGGQLIWDAVMEELLSLGLATARQALLSGCSAGGLAALIHCDAFHEMLPKEVNVKCLSDAGFFLDEKDTSGERTMRSLYHAVSNLQCLFPQNFVKYIKTPVFLVNPSYDWWQILHILVPSASDHSWLKCKRNIMDCNPSQIEILHGYRNSMLEQLKQFQRSRNVGMFINSCFSHCQTWMTNTWHSEDSPRINNKTIAEAVGDWYFDRKAVKEIDDAPYPSNPSCHNLDFNAFHKARRA